MNPSAVPNFTLPTQQLRATQGQNQQTIATQAQALADTASQIVPEGVERSQGYA